MMGPQQSLVGVRKPAGGLGSHGEPCCGCCCGEGPPDINTDGFLWLNNTVASPATMMTKDGSNRVSTWFNQVTGPHAAVDSKSEDSPGVPTPAGQWPVWTPATQNGLPMMAWSLAAFTHMHGLYVPGTFNKPTADNAPVTILAVVRVADNIGGMALTLRLNNNDLECGLFTRGGGSFQIPMSSAQDTAGVIFGHGLTPDVFDFTGRTLLCEWVFNGGGVAPQIYINGVLQSLYSVDTTLQAYAGNSGYSVGFCNANFNSIWRGFLGEIIGYLGTDATRRVGARTYLNAKWRVY